MSKWILYSFTGTYGGYQVDHIGYTRDDAFFDEWQQKTGQPYGQLLRRVFKAMEEHAKAQNWLPGVYGLIDETRDEDFARKQVEQIKAINEASEWVKTGGSYSVSFKDGRDPKNYHQWLFDVTDASALNGHDESVLAEAQKTGKQVYIYNQGLSRYSFGADQWSEFRKGVRGRHQWHLHVQHGYQFFDLDGREPDSSSVLYYGDKEPIPTLNLLRSAEGADDFYYCQTLHNRCEKACSLGGAAAVAAVAARKVLDDIEAKIKINENQKPAWLDNADLRRKCAEGIVAVDRAMAVTPPLPQPRPKLLSQHPPPSRPPPPRRPRPPKRAAERARSPACRPSAPWPGRYAAKAEFHSLHRTRGGRIRSPLFLLCGGPARRRAGWIHPAPAGGQEPRGRERGEKEQGDGRAP